MCSRITLEKEKLLLVNDKFEQEVSWNDIYCISFYKLDCITHIKTFITLDYEFGESIELHEEMIGWNEFINNIQDYLKIQDNTWKIKLENASSDDNAIKIY